MKTRESGMPEEVTWASFFDPEQVLTRLQLHPRSRCVVDFGCGYGTFAIPAARRITGVVHALDIDPAMIAATQTRAEAGQLNNIRVQQRDFVAHGTGLADAAADYVMLFNILHAELPAVLLQETWRVLGAGGTVAVMHWNHDANTPRGPSMTIRPHPEHLVQTVTAAGFVPEGGLIDLPPYHYGAVFTKP
ncbi:MAG: class I SAM-dependent methyltransferase [Phycisphaeraceae bacterium]